MFWTCDCCESGDCTQDPTGCPSSTPWTITVPSMALGYSGSVQYVENSPNVPATYTAGYVLCTDDYPCTTATRCEDCDAVATCGACDNFNYGVTVLPVVTKRCNTGDTDDCESTSPSGTKYYKTELGYGTSNAPMGDGNVVITYSSGSPYWDNCDGTLTVKPCISSLVWLPTVSNVATNPAWDYWRFDLTWYLCNPDGRIGDVHTTTCGAFDSCGRTNDFLWRELVDYVGFYRSATFQIKKELGSCFRSNWNGTTGGGPNVISITHDGGSGGDPHQLYQTGLRKMSQTGDCTIVLFDDYCSTCPQGTNFTILTSDPFYSSGGSNISWTLG